MSFVAHFKKYSTMLTQLVRLGRQQRTEKAVLHSVHFRGSALLTPEQCDPLQSVSRLFQFMFLHHGWENQSQGV